MEYSSASWFDDMGLEDPRFIHSCEMSSLDQFTTQHIAHALGAEDFHHHQQQNSSSESYTSLYTCATVDLPKNGGATVEATTTTTQACRPAKVPKTSSWNSCTTTKQVSAVVPDASSPTILSFGSMGVNNNSAKSKDAFEFSISKGSVPIRGSKRGGGGDVTNRPLSSTQDHILSERKRREKLSQRFIALSAIVPGLKKMDKASVLCDAIKYVKQLEDKVKTLEDQATKKTVESAVLVKKSQVPFDDDTSSTDENFYGQQTPEESLPEIEAKVSERTVLLRVHCEKKKGLLVRVLAEIERFHLGVVNTSVVPFAYSILDITIVAQMEEEFNMTVKDLVRNLSTAIREFK